MVREDKKWLACLLETEGTFGIHKATRPGKNSRYVSIVRVEMTFPNYIERAREIAKTGVTRRSKRKTKTGKWVYGWYVSGRDTGSVLRACFPFLLIKRVQADRLRKLNRSVDLNHRHVNSKILAMRERWYRTTKRLNK